MTEKLKELAESIANAEDCVSKCEPVDRPANRQSLREARKAFFRQALLDLPDVGDAYQAKRKELFHRM